MADKLATAFTAITNPADATLVMLADPVTAERKRITIGEFFGRTQGFTFTGNVIFNGGIGGSPVISGDTFFKKDNAIIEVQATDATRTIRLTNGATGLLPSIQGFSNLNAPKDLISWNHGVSDANRVLLFNGGGGNAQFLSLAGVGSRPVVVDANGVMSAP